MEITARIVRSRARPLLYALDTEVEEFHLSAISERDVYLECLRNAVLAIETEARLLLNDVDQRPAPLPKEYGEQLGDLLTSLNEASKEVDDLSKASDDDFRRRRSRLTKQVAGLQVDLHRISDSLDRLAGAEDGLQSDSLGAS